MEWFIWYAIDWGGGGRLLQWCGREVCYVNVTLCRVLGAEKNGRSRSVEPEITLIMINSWH